MNCIWITVDSFRQEHIHCYHPEGTSEPSGENIAVQTPNIDRLAEEGVRCTRLRTEALPTVPARRGNFTGKRVFPFKSEPLPKGMYISLPGWRPIPQDDITVAEHLSEQDYICGFVSDVYHLMKPSQNFHRGFHSFEWIRGQEYDRWKSQPLPEGYLDDYLKEDSHPNAYRNRVLIQYLKNQMSRSGDEYFQAAKVFRKAIEWLEQNYQHEKFFLYVDSFDPHEPFEAPQRFIELYDSGWKGPKLIYGNPYKRSELTDAEHHHIRSRYAAECSMVDYWLGQLLDTVERLGLQNNTLIIFLSDHGKILGEWNHYGMPPEDTGLELNSVPCILRHPSDEYAGTVFDGWIYNTDITVTMLSLLDVEEKPKTDGISLWKMIKGDIPSREYAVVGHGSVISCWQNDWLYLLNTKNNSEALYNLADEPLRQTDVFDKYPNIQKDMKAKIEYIMEESKRQK